MGTMINSFNLTIHRDLLIVASSKSFPSILLIVLFVVVPAVLGITAFIFSDSYTVLTK